MFSRMRSEGFLFLTGGPGGDRVRSDFGNDIARVCARLRAFARVRAQP